MERHSCHAGDTYASGLLQQRNYSKAYQACNSNSGVHSADIGIYTGQPIATDSHALCLNSWPAAFLARLDLNSASDSQTANSLRTLLQRFCNTLSPTCMAMHYMPNSYAKHPIFTLMLRALIQTIYRALLTSAVSGVGHRIQSLKKTPSSTG